MSSAFPGYVFTLMIYTGAIVLFLIHHRSPLPYMIAAPLAVVAIASLLHLYPLSGDRQNLFLTPLIVLTAAAAFDYIIAIDRRGLLPAVFLALIVWRAIPALSEYYPTYGDSAVGQLVRRVVAAASPGDPVYICRGGSPEVRYYIYARYPMPLNPIVEGIRVPGPRDYLEQVDFVLDQYKRAWLLVYPSCGDMEPLIDHLAKNWNVQLIETHYPDTELYFVN